MGSQNTWRLYPASRASPVPAASTIRLGPPHSPLWEENAHPLPRAWHRGGGTVPSSCSERQAGLGSRRTGTVQGPESAGGLGGAAAAPEAQTEPLLREHSPNLPRHLARPKHSPSGSRGQESPWVPPVGLSQPPRQTEDMRWDYRPPLPRLIPPYRLSLSCPLLQAARSHTGLQGGIWPLHTICPVSAPQLTHTGVCL